VGFVEDGGTMPSAKVSSKGQVVIPQEIRRALGIQPGDVLEFILEESGALSVRLAGRIPLEQLKGSWKRAGDPHLSDEDIAQAVREAACRRRA
jgi:AbrB family looped-hinge helix DNA binding protein